MPPRVVGVPLVGGQRARGHHSTVGSTSGVSRVRVDSDDEGMNRDAIPPLPQPRWNINLCQGDDIVLTNIAPPMMDDVPQIDPRHGTVHVGYAQEWINLCASLKRDMMRMSLHLSRQEAHWEGDMMRMSLRLSRQEARWEGEQSHLIHSFPQYNLAATLPPPPPTAREAKPSKRRKPLRKR